MWISALHRPKSFILAGSFIDNWGWHSVRWLVNDELMMTMCNKKKQKKQHMLLYHDMFLRLVIYLSYVIRFYYKKQIQLCEKTFENTIIHHHFNIYFVEMEKNKKQMYFLSQKRRRKVYNKHLAVLINKTCLKSLFST